MKELLFLGRSRADLRGFPEGARTDAGRELLKVQHGAEPTNWKPMTSIGSGVAEIRVSDATGAFRVVYVAKFEEAVYVLHCFEKRQQKTSRADLDLATSRYRDLVRDRTRN